MLLLDQPAQIVALSVFETLGIRANTRAKQPSFTLVVKIPIDSFSTMSIVYGVTQLVQQWKRLGWETSSFGIRDRSNHYEVFIKS